MFKKIRNIILKKINDKANIKLIKQSNLFSKKYYLMENPNVKIDAAKHYYYYGYKEGKSPSYLFSNDDYLKMNKDIAINGINPLIHYLKYGKSENRKILKDNGCSISELYYKLYNHYFNYNFYYCTDKLNKVNLFIEDDLNINAKIMNKIINYCKKNGFVLRLIYKKYNISKLKDMLTEIDTEIEIEYVYLNSNDYIFIGQNDIIISTGLKTAFALTNSNINNNKIFLYLDTWHDSVFNNSLMLQIYSNNKITFITDNKNLKDKINLYYLCFDVNRKFSSKKIYYYSKNCLILGFLLLNRLFLGGVYNYKKYSVYTANNKIKYHFDTEVFTYNINSQYNKKNNYLFYLTDVIDGEPIVFSKLEKSDKKIPFIFLENNDMQEINVIEKKDSDNYNFYEDFKLKMIDARNEE